MYSFFLSVYTFLKITCRATFFSNNFTWLCVYVCVCMRVCEGGWGHGFWVAVPGGVG